MSKRARSTRRAKREQPRQTNWLLIGAVIVAAVVGLFVLLALALQEPEVQTVADYCLENPGNCATAGAADAPVTVVEVSDYGCSHCRDFNLQTAGLIQDLYVTPGQVQWVVLPFALSTQTLPAATAAMCAGDQDRFFEFHHRMFEMQSELPSLTLDGFGQAAGDLGLDADALNACLESGKYDGIVQQNIRAANMAGVSATPTFFINDQKIEGNRPLTDFQQQISSLLGAADAS